MTERDGGAERAARRLPGLVWAAWAVALAVLGVLTAAVLNQLHAGSGGHGSADGMAGMGGSMSRALYRTAGAPAHGPLLSSKLFTAWQLDAVAVAVLLVVGTGYLTGVLLAGRRSGASWPIRYTVAFLAGLVVCALATNSSIAVYDMSLFSAHMIGHLMLVMLAPALLAAGRPLSLLLQASRPGRRERLAALLTGRLVSLLTAPPVALASYSAVIVGTHLTGLMDFIMRNAWAGQLEHLVYVLLGCQFFVVVIGDAPIRWRLSVPARFFMLALSMAVDTFTGLVLLQGGTAVTMAPPPGASINPLTDTQTGGAIMWFGGDGIMAVIMVIVAISWVRRPEAARIEAGGWLEQARRASFAEHTGTADQFAEDSEVDFDDDERRLRQYNEWLHRLDSHPNRRS